MNTLEQWANQNPQWSLEEFVEVINQLLPQFLPLAKNNSKVRPEITPRLVRHYTTVGMVDEPKKAGKYAIYTYRHLLQLLLVRRLLAEGMSANVINDLARQKSNIELKNWLTGDVQLDVFSPEESNNSALDYLQKLRSRHSVPKTQSPSQPLQEKQYDSPKKPNQPTSSQWIRWEIMPGLELHIRSDFKFPKTLNQQEQLLEKIKNLIETLSLQKFRQ